MDKKNNNTQKSSENTHIPADADTIQETLRNVVEEYKNLLQERQDIYQNHLEKLTSQNIQVENHFKRLLDQKDEHIQTLMKHLQQIQFTGSLSEPWELSEPAPGFEPGSGQKNIATMTMEAENKLDVQSLEEEFETPENEPDTENSTRFQQKLIKELRILRNDLPGLFLNFFMNLADFNLYVEVDPTHWKSFDIDEKKDTVAMVQNIYVGLADTYEINLDECEIRFMDPPGETLARYWKNQMSIIE